MKCKKARSLNAEIKKVIGSRIIICSLMLLVVIISLTLFDMSTSLEHLRDQINHQVKPLEDFTIGEVMIDNPQAIAVKLEDFNKLNSGYEVKWVPYNKAPFESVKLTPPFNWVYNYQLGSIAGYQFGYFKISGSLLSDRSLIYSLLIRLLVLVIFSLALFGFLYPVAKGIPKKLFVDPINRFLNLISNPETNKAPTKEKQLPLELQSLENKIRGLLTTVKEHERNKALIQMGEMATQVAHDLRNYLLGLNEWLENISPISSVEKDKAYEYVKAIELMSSNLLKRYKTDRMIINSYQDSPLSLTDQLKKALFLAEIKCKLAQVNLRTNISHEQYPLFIAVDSSIFKRIIVNLINNAIEAEPKSRNICLKLFIHSSFVVININDDGKGIPPHVLEKIGKTEVTYGKADGHGIGLYHAYQSLKKWGGALEVYSQEEVGTQLTLRIPLAAPPKWYLSKLNLKKTKKILIIDDDKTIHDQWSNKLTHLKHLIIEHFFNPHDLTTYLSENFEPSSTIFLMDYQFNNCTLTGLDLIKQHQLSSQAILVTGRSEDYHIIEECLLLSLNLLPKNNIPLVPIIY